MSSSFSHLCRKQVCNSLVLRREYEAHQFVNQSARRAPSCRRPSCRARCASSSTSRMRDSTIREVDNFERLSRPFFLYAKLFPRLRSFLSDEKCSCGASRVDLGTLQQTPSNFPCRLFLASGSKEEICADMMQFLMHLCSSQKLIESNSCTHPARSKHFGVHFWTRKPRSEFSDLSSWESPRFIAGETLTTLFGGLVLHLALVSFHHCAHFAIRIVWEAGEQFLLVWDR